MTVSRQETLQRWIESACIWEAAASKPGNVHPGAAFDDLCYDDFVAAARASAPHLARAAESGVGRAILEATTATREVCGTNVNLGICLLLAPLAAVPMDTTLTKGVAAVLSGLDDADARNVYEAIRVANPGGLGESSEQDVAQQPTCSLVEAMTLAEYRDRIAWNYAHSFEDVVITGPKLLDRWIERGEFDRSTLIIALQLELLCANPDTLIARKCGPPLAQQVSERARNLLASGWPTASDAESRRQEFDAWLRSDGHRLNPGTTADLVAAILFTVLRDHPQIADRLG